MQPRGEDRVMEGGLRRPCEQFSDAFLGQTKYVHSLYATWKLRSLLYLSDLRRFLKRSSNDNLVLSARFSQT